MRYLFNSPFVNPRFKENRGD